MAFMQCFCMQIDRRQVMLLCWEHKSARTGAVKTAAPAVSFLLCTRMEPVRRKQAVGNHQAPGEPLLEVRNTAMGLGDASCVP